MAISTEPKAVTWNSNGTVGRLFGQTIPKGVIDVAVQNKMEDSQSVIYWRTKTGEHSMVFDPDNASESLLAVLVTMRMTC